MKMLLWILLGLFVTGLAFWILTLPGVPRNPVLMALIVGIFVVPPFGAFWMLYIKILGQSGLAYQAFSQTNPLCNEVLRAK